MRASKPRPPLPGRTGRGRCIAHHGELVQGSFPCGAGSAPGLVTVPLPQLGACAQFQPSARPGVRAGHGLGKARRAAQLTLRLCRERQVPCPPGGRLRIESGIPPGWGMGSSTADVVATIRAVGDCCGLRLSRREVSELARRAETASDPLAYGCVPLLFAHRHGRVIRHWPRAFPRVHVVGCRVPGGPVETLDVGGGQYSPRERRECLRILQRVDRAVSEQDAALLGEAATRSALLNQSRLPKPALPTLLAVCRETGGVGVQVAHSGTVCAVLVDARRPGAAHRAREARTALDSLGLERTVDMIWGGA
ncbi:hypothetical protein [Kocuria sp.]|uniref:GHMP family kinase ATP-binding protein n=1 Tax=Kocuria sp. TaxID=1871328 RepID=UPI0026DDA263|nr:hypothetical protein [Kocuria sp.]MDO4919594.1 hypothetical protein [Kocuria sp.]